MRKNTYKTITLYIILLLIVLIATSFNSLKIDNNLKEKIIYLTFDDGPSKKVTEDCLDILKKYNVKATFFVIGEQFKGNEYVLKRINNEGHTLGLHTYTHNFSKLYRGHKVNEEFFLNEMIKSQKELEEITGIKSTILRFPGGSHNRLNEDFLSELQKYNFRVYDWTHSSEDAINHNTPPNIRYKNSLKKIPSSKKSPGVILLMHCNGTNKNSVKALPLIIEHYKKEGYKFLPITQNTPEYHCE